MDKRWSKYLCYHVIML
uniref:Uncharacterized protein n=1 Tax=Bracon brevicornis TaxID=1563983 RepID=A0A6V7KVI1_9HYME